MGRPGEYSGEGHECLACSSFLATGGFSGLLSAESEFTWFSACCCSGSLSEFGEEAPSFVSGSDSTPCAYPEFALVEGERASEFSVCWLGPT